VGEGLKKTTAHKRKAHHIRQWGGNQKNFLGHNLWWLQQKQDGEKKKPLDKKEHGFWVVN